MMNPALDYRQPDFFGNGIQPNMMGGFGPQLGPRIQQFINNGGVMPTPGAMPAPPAPGQPAPGQPMPAQPVPQQNPGTIEGSPGTQDPGGIGGYGGIDGSPGTQDPGGIGSQLPGNATPTNIFGNPFQFQDQRQQDAFGRFMTSPDYQFRMNEGVRAMDSSAAQRGLLLSGNQLRSLQEFGQGMAAGEFGNYYNRMAGIAGLSQPTDFGGFAGLGANTLANLQGSRGNLTANLGNIQGAGANAQGAILGNMFGSIPWSQVGTAIGNVFGGNSGSGFSTGGGFVGNRMG
jgi:hypothetical protein